MIKRLLLNALALITVIASVVIGTAAFDSNDTATAEEVLKFEVAEDGNRFIFDDQHLFEDGMPDYGTAFVTQGYIYPEGTLDGTNGVLPNGEPEFPEKVLGEWTCYGYLIGEGMHTESGEVVVSTQVYKFNGGSTIVTDGFELADLNENVARAISGGTLDHNGVSGEQLQALLGFSEVHMGVNLSIEFHLQ
jgi:hypothetical protein